MQEAPTKLVYTSSDLQRMFCISRRTLQRWRQSQHLPAQVLPGRWERTLIDKWWSDKLRQSMPLSDITIGEGM
jgi:hypothetical protein